MYDLFSNSTHNLKFTQLLLLCQILKKDAALLKNILPDFAFIYITNFNSVSSKRSQVQFGIIIHDYSRNCISKSLIKLSINQVIVKKHIQLLVMNKSYIGRQYHRKIEIKFWIQTNLIINHRKFG